MSLLDFIKGNASGIAGGAAKIGGAVVGALAGARAQRRQQRLLNERKRENELWYNRRYNELGSERSDAVNMLSQMRAAQQARMNRLSGANAVVGGTTASQATEKQAQNAAIGSTVAGINASAEAKRAGIEAQYRNTASGLANKQSELYEQQARNIQSAASQLGAMGDELMKG